MPDVHLQSRRFVHQLPACISCGVDALRVARVLLMIGGLCCIALGSLAQIPDSTTEDQPDKSWTATTDSKSDGLLPTRIPVRIVESHSQNGERTLDKRSV